MRRRALSVGLGLGLVTFAPSFADALIDGLAPRPAPQLRRDATDAAALAIRNGACATCHRAIADEWRASYHARAYSNEAFQAALDREWPHGRAFCRGCHAPEADASSPPPSPLAAMGVGCITCHVPLGPVLAATPQDAKAVKAPHATRFVPAFATAAACAPCHEFPFPRGDGEPIRAGMQRTVTEHARVEGEGASCASCHMPTVGEGSGAHRSHRFRGGHDPDLVRSALRVSAERRGATVEVTLAPERVTHAVPTGDFFRRLAVIAEGRAGSGEIVARKQVFLARHFRREPGRASIEVGDDRPHGAPRVVRLVLDPAAAGSSIAWRVVYQRVAHQTSDDEADAVIEGEIVVGSGTLAP